jgi:hypothetical protein
MKFLLFLMLSGLLVDAPLVVPENAKPNRYGSGWTCNSGFKKVGDTCSRVEIPPNGKLNYLGSGWECNSGFKKVGDTCSRVEIPPNGKLNYLGSGWECNSGYKIVSGGCVAMSDDEIKQMEARQRSIIAAVAARRSSLLSGDTCEAEPKSGAEVCLNVTNLDFDCSKSSFANYYNSCEATVSYELETNFKGRGYLDVDVECNVEIEFSGKGILSTRTDSETNDESSSLYANGSESETLQFDFSFSSFEEVNKARIVSHRCEIDEINLY